MNVLSKTNSYLFQTTKKLLKNNLGSFFSLSAINSLIMLCIILINQWFVEQYDLGQLNIQTIVFRCTLFLLFLGIWVGFFKQIFND